MKFSDLAKYKTGSGLVISNRHEKWMESNSNPVYSDKALQFVGMELAKQAHPRKRKGTVSASSLGSCRRRQQFTFIGMPELPPSPKLAAIFQTGTFMHIRWQMAGITEGWLAEAEVPVGANPLRLSGTMDGIADDGSIVEFKSINSNGFRNIMSFGPKEMHLYQGASYALTTGREQVTFLYEDKDTQEFKEWVKTVDELPMTEAAMSAQITWDLIDSQELAEPLAECEEKAGYMFNGCPFRTHCLKIRGWSHAEEIAGG